MALDVSEKYQSQIRWPLEHLVICVAFRQFKRGELCSVACIYCVCMYMYVHITFVNIQCVSVYFGVFV